MNTNTNNTTTAFERVKRDYENALASGKDTSTELTALATAVAYSVINKCIDPQRKTATDRDTVSDNGYNPALVAIKNGIAADLAILDNTRRNADKATRTTYNADGDTVTETTDNDAENALAALIGKTLSDGIDLVQTAAVAILEQAAEHANGENWLESKYTVRRLSKRVYIQSTDSAAYAEIETTPIQEIYRAVRQAVQDSRAIQTDPRNGYTYIEDLTADGLETIYHRLGKYADLGGYDCNDNYTADPQTVTDYETIIEKLNLTDRQAQIIRLRMQGKGYKAIATYFGIPQSSVCRCMYQVREKAEKIGFTPSMWKEMTSENDN